MSVRVANFHPPMLYEALKAEGFHLPDECGDVHMTMPVDGMMQLHYTVNLTQEDLVKIGKALARLGGKRLLDVTTHEDPPGTRKFADFDLSKPIYQGPKIPLEKR